MRARRASRFVIGRADGFAENEHRVVDVGGRSIGVFRVGEEFYALLNRCPHQGGPLCEGEYGPMIRADGVGEVWLDDERPFVTCPWHGWEFDVRDGQSYCSPGRWRVKPYPVEVEAGTLVQQELAAETVAPAGELVKGPFKAERIDIEVEDDYVVVRLR